MKTGISRKAFAVLCLCMFFRAMALGAAEPDAGAAESPKPAAPKPVGEEARLLLDTKIALSVKEMELTLALEWGQKLVESKLPIFASREAGAKKVTFEAIDLPLAGILRLIKEQTGNVYRYHEGQIQIVTPKELERLQRGEVTFAQLAPAKEK